MRGINGFRQLIENIHYFVQERNRRKIQLEIWIMFVATYQNIRELPEFVRLAHQLGVDFVEGKFLCAYTPDMWTQSLVYHRNLCNRMFEEAEKVAKELGIKLHLPAYFDLSLTRAQMDKGEFLDSCREPWEYIYVTNEQTVRACCCNMSIMGDLEKTGLDEIWNGKEYQGFRQHLSSDKKQYVCRFCFLNYLYADVNNVCSHLIDIKPHYDELGISETIHRPDKPELETVIADFINSEGN